MAGGSELGEFGGDVLQRVMGPLNQHCGTILWEVKRTKNWSDGWLAKLRDDQRAAKADIALLVSHAIPKEVHRMIGTMLVFVLAATDMAG